MTSIPAALLLALALALAACSPAAEPISRSHRDPSSPSAAEGVNPLAASAVSAPNPVPNLAPKK